MKAHHDFQRRSLHIYLVFKSVTAS